MIISGQVLKESSTEVYNVLEQLKYVIVHDNDDIIKQTIINHLMILLGAILDELNPKMKIIVTVDRWGNKQTEYHRVVNTEENLMTIKQNVPYIYRLLRDILVHDSTIESFTKVILSIEQIANNFGLKLSRRAKRRPVGLEKINKLSQKDPKRISVPEKLVLIQDARKKYINKILTDWKFLETNAKAQKVR